MTALLATILGFPTVLFTILLGVVLLYWAMVFLGALHIDLLGAADAGVDGHVDGVIDGHIDGALDGHVDGALDGHLDGAMGHHGVEGHGNLGDGADGAADGHDIGESGVFASALAALRLRSAPATVVISLWTTFSWFFSILVTQFLGARSSLLLSVPFQLLTLFGASVLGLLCTSILIRPLAPLFVVRHARTNHELVGHSCVIRTGTVDAKFGEATLEDDGVVLVVQVRSDAGVHLKRGEQALILGWDEEKNAFNVAPMRDILAERIDIHGVENTSTPEEKGTSSIQKIEKR